MRNRMQRRREIACDDPRVGRRLECSSEVDRDDVIFVKMPVVVAGILHVRVRASAPKESASMRCSIGAIHDFGHSIS
jgi:hypothetical protein